MFWTCFLLKLALALLWLLYMLFHDCSQAAALLFVWRWCCKSDDVWFAWPVVCRHTQTCFLSLPFMCVNVCVFTEGEWFREGQAASCVQPASATTASSLTLVFFICSIYTVIFFHFDTHTNTHAHALSSWNLSHHFNEWWAALQIKWHNLGHTAAVYLRCFQ